MSFLVKAKKQSGIVLKIILAMILSLALSLLAVLCSAVLYNLSDLSPGLGELINSTMNALGGYSLTAVLTIIFFAIAYSLMVKAKATSWETLGLRSSPSKSLKHLAIGFGIGSAIICATMTLLIAANQVSFSYSALTSDKLWILLSGILIQFSVALSEEITFRGFIQGELYKRTSSKYITVLATSLAFALMHLINGSYSLLSLIYLAVCGVLFSVLRLMTNNLWLVIGFHLANNWVELYVFGFNTANENHWLTTVNKANNIWNGGGSGGGLIYVALLVITLIIALKCEKGRKAARIAKNV